MNEKRVSFNNFLIIKEPRMSAIVYGRGGLNLPYSKVGGPAEGGMKGNIFSANITRLRVLFIRK